VDIQVDAVVPGSTSPPMQICSVVVEIKGCWNRGLRTAMQTQLVDRYLRDNACRHGLYVVGWFMCENWDSADSRRRNVPWPTLEQATAELDTQAQTLTNSIGAGEVRAYVLDCALR
jgi:hypothetical protein